jgi:hypothetical protein
LFERLGITEAGRGRTGRRIVEEKLVMIRDHRGPDIFYGVRSNA